MIVIIIDTSKRIRRTSLEEDYHIHTEVVTACYAPMRYECEDLDQALRWYVYDCNEAHSEFNATSFKVHQILVYRNEFENETPYLLTDMTPYESYFKQIKCYDWSEPNYGGF